MQGLKWHFAAQVVEEGSQSFVSFLCSRVLGERGAGVAATREARARRVVKRVFGTMVVLEAVLVDRDW